MPTVATNRLGSGGIRVTFDVLATGADGGVVYNGPATGEAPFDDFGYSGHVTPTLPWTGTASWGGQYTPQSSTGPAHRPITYDATTSVRLQARSDLPPVDVKHVEGAGVATLPYGTDSGTTYSVSWKGTLHAEVVCDEYLYYDALDRTEATYYPDPDDPNSLGFPVTGGNAMPNGLPATKASFYLVPREGYPCTVTATVGGSDGTATSVSQTFPWDSSFGELYFGMEIRHDCGGHSATGASTAYPRVMGLPILAQASHDFSYGSFHYGISGGTSTCSSSSTDAGMLVDAALPNSYEYRAAFVGADGQPFPKTLTVATPVDSFDVAGSATHTVSEKDWSVRDYADGSLVQTAGEQSLLGWMTAAISQGSLRAARLDTRDWRLPIKGSINGGITPAFAPTSTVYSGSAATVTYAGETAGNWGGYRYLERRVTAPMGRVVTMSVSGSGVPKTFSAKKLADGAEWVRFDLCSPTNLPSVPAFRRDGPYPLQPQATHMDNPVGSPPDDEIDYLDAIVDPPLSGDEPDESLQTWTNGVDAVSSAAFSVASQDGDGPVAWGGARLTSVGTPLVTVREGFCGQGKILQDGYDCLRLWQLTAHGGRTAETGGVWGAPLLWVSVDGKLVYALPGCAYRQFVVGGYEWAYDSARTMAANLGHLIGWSCSVTEGANFYGLGIDSYANLLAGEGCLYDGGFQFAVDRPLGLLRVQDSWDWVQGWPGCGDVWQRAGGATGSAMVVAAGQVVGVRSQGLVLQGDDSATPGAPLSGAEVWNERRDHAGTSSSTTPALFGKGTSGTDGSYSTSVLEGPVGRPQDPYAYDGLEYGDETGTTTLQQGPKPQETARFRSGWIERTSFRAVAQSSAGGIALLATPDGTLWRASVESGTLKVRTALNGGPKLGWFSTYSVTGAGNPRESCLTWDSVSSRAFLVFDTDSGIYACYSDSHGETWTTPVADPIIPNGKVPRRRHDLNGDCLYTAIVGGVLMGAWRGMGDLAFSSPFPIRFKADGSSVAISTDAALGSYDQGPVPFHDGRWSFAIVRAGDTGPTDWFSRDEGRTLEPAS